ncbi:MAG: cupredoxin domain-containing protein [Bacteriovorax sp.]|nr:cupredoxin domain-containing protein [Bacteriovorax sp.]
MKCLMFLSALIFSGISVAKTAPNEYKLVITEKGYEPGTLKVKAGSPVVLKITRKTNATCAREVLVPSQNLKFELPLDKEVTVKIASLPKGEIKFGCAMNMMVGGVMIAE